jgi:hypothetical protein
VTWAPAILWLTPLTYLVYNISARAAEKRPFLCCCLIVAVEICSFSEPLLSLGYCIVAYFAVVAVQRLYIHIMNSYRLAILIAFGTRRSFPFFGSWTWKHTPITRHYGKWRSRGASVGAGAEPWFLLRGNRNRWCTAGPVSQSFERLRGEIGGGLRYSLLYWHLRWVRRPWTLFIEHPLHFKINVM